MQANNVPTDAGDGIPPATWAVLWDKIKPLSVSVAKAMATQFGNVGWADALKVSVDAHAEAAGNANELKRRVGTYADSPGRLYFLVVVNGRIQVLYGWRPCRALENDGRVWARQAPAKHSTPR